MPQRRNWDDRWRQHPPSKPLPTVQGIATSRQRGDMASNWWSARLVELLDSYGLGGRMQRGRRYARQGQLLSFEVHLGFLVAQVQGSRTAPYVVTVAVHRLDEPQWAAVRQAMAARVAFTAQLLAGQVPPELEGVFADAGVALLPRRWSDVQATCSCPDWENPCKHIAAVLYVFADRLDQDPWLLLRWRGRDRDEVLAGVRSGGPRSEEVAPWWPLVPGAPLPEGERSTSAWSGDDPAATLTRLGPLGLTVRSRPLHDVLANVYAAIRDATP